MTAAEEPNRRRFLETATVSVAFVLGVLLLAFFMLVLPGTVGYTLVWGQRAVATIEACEQRQVRYDATYLDCRGSWRLTDGTRDFGHVSGVGRADIGREVPVRVGPLGPYAGGLDRSRHALIPGAILWAVTLSVTGIVLSFTFRGRARARRVLARVGEGGDLAVMGRRRLRDGHGRTLLRFRASARPPGALSGPGEEQRFATRRPFAVAHLPSGGVAFSIARLAGGLAVFDAGGQPALVMRRADHAPPRLDVLACDRTPLGRIVPCPDGEDRPGAAFALTTETGETVAVIVAGFLRWTVVFHGDPPELLRRAATAFAFDALRLTR